MVLKVHHLRPAPGANQRVRLLVVEAKERVLATWSVQASKADNFLS
jgi:hypothetical protein